jgi:hypothetical protein
MTKGRAGVSVGEQMLNGNGKGESGTPSRATAASLGELNIDGRFRQNDKGMQCSHEERYINGRSFFVPVSAAVL